MRRSLHPCIAVSHTKLNELKVMKPEILKDIFEIHFNKIELKSAGCKLVILSGDNTNVGYFIDAYGI